MSVRVSDVMTADVITVGPEAFVHKAARLMSDHGVSGLPIVDADGRVIAIVPKAISSSGRLRSFRAPQVVALGALEFLDDLAALSEKAPRFLSAREEERAEPELVAQAASADQIPISDQTPERE